MSHVIGVRDGKMQRSGHGDVIGIYRLDSKEVWIQTDLNEDPQTTIFLPEER